MQWARACFSKSGPFRVPQFPLYLRNADVLSHQTSQPYPFGFSFIKNMLKDQLLNTSGLQFDNWIFSGPKSVRHTVLRNGTLGSHRKRGRWEPTLFHLSMGQKKD